MKTKAALILASLLFAACTVIAQTKSIFQMSPDERNAYFAKIGTESDANWHKMVERLKIQLPTSLPLPAEDPNRPKGTFQKSGSSNWYDSVGNTYVRTAWGTWNNYDEARANPYPSLPDPLLLKDGRRVVDTETWWRVRRPELQRQFDEEIFGRVPENVPPVRWKVVHSLDSTIGNTPVVIRDIVGHVDNAADPDIVVDIQLTITTPAGAGKPVPVIMEFGFIFPPGFSFPGMPKPAGPTWQEQVLAKGWGYAIYVPTSVQPDNAAGLTEGIIGLVNKGKLPQPDDWGALRAWAWGGSRILDYFEKDPSIDARRVGIEGVSRYGKAVLATMAYDSRFAIVLVGSSGKGGATFYRRDFGESMGNICSSGEYHWFAGNLLNYVTDPSALSVDSHELIALCAPRPVFISCGSPTNEGRWIDDTGQFLAEVAAGPVYKLFGENDLGITKFPPMGTTIDSGALAFRQHEDGHTVGPNWPYFLAFAQKYFDRGDAEKTRK